MAIEIKFEGYINEVKRFDWGIVYDIAHSQFKKGHQGDWEVAGKDYFSVIGPEGFEKDQRVAVTGRMKTKRFDKRDGSKGISLEVRADSITLVPAGTKRDDKVGHAAINAVWDVAPIPGSGKPIDEQPPF